MSSSIRRVGLLTGTFDPVHLGHVALARGAQDACELDEVWFLVNPQPAHKQGVTALVDRLAMVRLAVTDEPLMREGEPEARPAGSARHTMADFGQMMARYPDVEFVFIVGVDVLATLGSWEEADLARGMRYAVARRGGKVAATDPRLQVLWFDLTEHVGASSRKVQAQLQAGRRPDELDERVYEYIREQRLYT